MKRKIMKTLAIGVAIVMMVSSLAGCGKSADSNASLTGIISIAGSTSMEKLCEAMSESFMELIEFGDTKQIFSYPQDKRTEDYITGRFG